MIKTVDIVKALRLQAALISYSAMATAARGMALSYDRNLLVGNGGHYTFPMTGKTYYLQNDKG